MGKELKFSRLSEVEKVENVSANACALVEDEGKIKRVTGGLGGEFVFDITSFLEEAEFYETSEDIPDFPDVPIVINNTFLIKLVTPLTEEQFQLLKTKMTQGSITIGGNFEEEDGMSFFMNEKYSTQFFSVEEEDFEFGLLTPMGSVFSLLAMGMEEGFSEYLFGYVIRNGENRLLEIGFCPLAALMVGLWGASE